MADADTDPASGDPPDPEHPDRPWYPGSLGGWLYLGVLVATGVGLVLVVTDDWRVGVRWEAGALLGAALLRLLLPKRDAGMLAVRHRLVDVLVLAVTGGVLIFLASTIPDQAPL